MRRTTTKAFPKSTKHSMDNMLKDLPDLKEHYISRKEIQTHRSNRPSRQNANFLVNENSIQDPLNQNSLLS